MVSYLDMVSDQKTSSCADARNRRISGIDGDRGGNRVTQPLHTFSARHFAQTTFKNFVRDNDHPNSNAVHMYLNNATMRHAMKKVEQDEARMLKGTI